MQRDKRTLISGVLIVAALLGARRIAPAWSGWRDAQETAARAAAGNIVAARRARAELPRLRDSLVVRERLLASYDSALVAAPSVAIAAVDVAARVAEIARDAGVTVASQQIVPDSANVGGLRRVAVRLTGTADVKALAALLRDVAEDERLLSIRELAVSQSDPTATSKIELLRVEVVVEALCVIDAVRGVHSQ